MGNKQWRILLTRSLSESETDDVPVDEQGDEVNGDEVKGNEGIGEQGDAGRGDDVGIDKCKPCFRLLCCKS